MMEVGNSAVFKKNQCTIQLIIHFLIVVFKTSIEKKLVFGFAWKNE